MRLTLTHVTKKFGIITAIDDINLQIDSGEFVFICGPSGAGKSTLIKLVLAQMKPTSGQILLGDTDITSATKKEIEYTRRRIGIIFQDYQLIPDRTIEENIHLALDIVSYPSKEVISQVSRVLEQVGLASRRSLFPSQLSGGELQRASLARALAVNPKIILADEPTGNLDVDNSWRLLKLLNDVNRQQKTTIIMTTHNTDILQSLKRRTIHLREGRIINDSSS